MFVEPKLESGFPDAVIVYWRPEVARHWPSPQALSEFGLPALDFARDRQRLESLRPGRRLITEESALLFDGARPSASGFDRSMSFRHYLDTLHKQCGAINLDSFDACIDEMQGLIDRAGRLLNQLRTAGVTAGQRSFLPAAEASQSALLALVEDRGAMLRRRWIQFRQ